MKILELLEQNIRIVSEVIRKDMQTKLKNHNPNGSPLSDAASFTRMF